MSDIEELRRSGHAPTVGEILGETGAIAPALDPVEPPRLEPPPAPAGELWQDHPAYAGYQVSTLGRVRKLVELSPQADRDGYVEVVVWVDGKKRRRTIHSLVLETFTGPRPPHAHGRHLNGVKSDNTVDNLAWGTPLQNAADNLVNGAALTGVRHANAKLTEEAVAHIRRQADTTTAAAFAELYGVSRTTIMQVLTRRAWKYVD